METIIKYRTKEGREKAMTFRGNKKELSEMVGEYMELLRKEESKIYWMSSGPQKKRKGRKLGKAKQELENQVRKSKLD